jgi:valyl-tRNA synthetase
MNPNEPLAPQYDATGVEAPLYADWTARDLFRPQTARGGKPYVIVIPPPNVTAVLHMGHGLNNTVQDVLVRFERMRGRETLWLPGTDHAGIATQNAVEKLLGKEGKSRFDLGREAFVARVWEHVRATGGTILDQLKSIGCSCDWTRTRFTLDPGLSTAVREVFVRLWEEELIYRGHRVIHWCPRCHTALSDEEAEHAEIQGSLYHIHYPLADGSGRVTVATTRPETMLGDVAVAVNPGDQARAAFVGRAAADRRRAHPDHRRRPRRDGLRDRVREDHARARRRRLRGGQAPRPADAGGDDARGPDGGRGPRGRAGRPRPRPVPRDGPLRGAPGDRLTADG